MSVYGTLPILIIAGVLIVADFAIGMLLLSNKTTISILSSAPIHTHYETKDEINRKNEIKSEEFTRKINKGKNNEK